MKERCTCGAALSEDARFCHKCGKPQYEEDVARWTTVETAAQPVRPAAPPLHTAPRISFRNSRAVMISLIVAAGALLGIAAAALINALLAPLILCAAGFLAAVLYKRQSSEPLSAAAGARIGWMTGLWLFFVVAVCISIMALYIASPTGRELLRSLPNNNPELAKILQDPHDFLASLPLSILQAFLLITLLPGLGGMLGARLSSRTR